MKRLAVKETYNEKAAKKWEIGNQLPKLKSIKGSLQKNQDRIKYFRTYLYDALSVLFLSTVDAR